jgi:anaerobic magnesium-protoporphyrin IX monomethyl ester cyclase
MASLALIEPRAPGYHVYSFAALPRLGLPALGTILTGLGHRVRIYCQGLSRLRLRDVLEADLVGISTTTSTAPEAYRIADLCRAHGKPVLIGGVHATFRPAEALEHADCCIVGEAESVIGEVVEQMLAGTQPQGVPSACFRLPDLSMRNGDLCRVVDLDSLPFPDLGLIQGWRPGSITPMMTSRGCPFDCTFCAVAPMFGRRYRFRSTDLVLEELRRRETRTVFFYDDNFAADRRRTKEILEGMMRLPRPVRWMAQVRADVAEDRELVSLMKASRCDRLFIGYESISPETLQSYNKHLDPEQVLESVRVLHEHNIKVHGMFVLGADADDESSIRRTVRFALQHALDSVQFLILTPLPGTRQFELLERAKRIFVRDWSLYDGHHVVYQPLKMTAAALQQEASKAHKRFYSAWQCAKSFARLRFSEGILKAYGRAVTHLADWQSRRFSRTLPKTPLGA